MQLVIEVGDVAITRNITRYNKYFFTCWFL